MDRPSPATPWSNETLSTSTTSSLQPLTPTRRSTRCVIPRQRMPVGAVCFYVPSICLPVCLSQGAAALGYSHRRPPEMCGLRTGQRTDVDPPLVEMPSLLKLRPCGAIQICLLLLLLSSRCFDCVIEGTETKSCGEPMLRSVGLHFLVGLQV